MDTIELFNDDKSCKINFVYMEDRRCYFSIYEFINISYGKDIHDTYGKDMFKNMFALTEICSYYYSVEGKKSTAMTDIKSLQQILIMLPDEPGKKYIKISESSIDHVLSSIHPKDNSKDISFLQTKIDILSENICKLEHILYEKDECIQHLIESIDIVVKTNKIYSDISKFNKKQIFEKFF